MEIKEDLKKANPLHKEFSKLVEADFKGRSLKENEVIEAKVVEKLKAYVVVDCRGKSEPMIPISEFTPEELSKIKVNDKLMCFVERIESMKTGEIVLSYRKAKSLSAWKKCMAAYEKEEPLVGYARTRIKGGFVLELFDGAISAFLPQSHLDTRPIKGAAVERLMNTPIKVKIVRVDKSRGNLSVSRRILIEQNRSAETAEALKTISEGQICDTTVRAVTSWGVFVNYKESLDFLIHVSDLDYGRVKQPSDLVTVGQPLRCKIIKICKDTNRISASVKDLHDSPYKDIEKKYKVGSIYPATIVKLQPYGAFASLEKHIEGLIHSSNCSHIQRNVNPNSIFKIGDKVNVKVLSLEKADRKISLSFKDCFPNPWDKVPDLVGKEVKVKVVNVTDKAVFCELIDLKLIGMMHFKELSFSENVDELKKYRKGAEISVKLMESKDEKLRFSKRALLPDPLDWFKKNSKKVGSILSTKVVEVMKTGVKVAVDPEKKIIVTIKKNQLAVEPADCRPEIYSVGNTMADAKLEVLDLSLRKVVLSPKAAQQEEQASLIQKFGAGANKSGITLRSLFDKAIGSKKKKKKEEK